MRSLEFRRYRPARALVVALITLSAAIGFGSVRAQEAPDALVKRVSQDVISTIKSDPQIQAGNQARIHEMIETKLLPYFDFRRMTALAVGRNWRRATPEQQNILTEQFKTLLVRTYSSALNHYRNETIEYKPLRMNSGDTEVTVHTQVMRSVGTQPVQMDYSLEKTPDGWKAYDVIVGGVSLVTNYRDEFNTLVSNGGIEGLIKSLETKNAGVPPALPAAAK
jgi:phospholipid transport system substrate-binding protein